MELAATWLDGRKGDNQEHISLIVFFCCHSRQHLTLSVVARSAASTKLFMSVSIQFYLNNKSSPVNFLKHDNIPYNMEVVSWP